MKSGELIQVSTNHHKALKQMSKENGTKIRFEAQKAMEQSAGFMIYFNKVSQKRD